MSSRKPEDLDERLQALWNTASLTWNLDLTKPQVFLTCTHRTKEEQIELFKQGRSLPGPIVTWTLNSKHNYYPSLAFDIAFKERVSGKLNWDPKLFKDFAKLVGQLDKRLIWGGFFKNPDMPHFEI